MLIVLLAAFLPGAAGNVDPHRAPVTGLQVRPGTPTLTYAAARRRGQPVAVLVRAVRLRASPGGRTLAVLGKRTEFGTPTVLAAVGERGAWLRVLSSWLPNGRAGWIPASAAGIVASPWRVLVELSSRRVTVFRGRRAVRRIAVAVGRPSTPTPVGRFAVTDKLRIAGGSAAYGCCALALSGHQPHIEPGWRGGDRLAIHGTALPWTIGTAASFGCLRARDEDVRWLLHHLLLGTIVEIRS